MNIEEATKRWVDEFSFINQSILMDAVGDDLDRWIDLTGEIIAVGDKVYYNGEDWEVLETLEDDMLFLESLDDPESMGCVEVDACEVELEQDYYRELFPMWGFLFNPKEDLDEEWILNNLDIVKECGFRAFEYYPTGDIFLGVDGAGYNFYDAHWIPLYKARGLKWHDMEVDNVEA